MALLTALGLLGAGWVARDLTVAAGERAVSPTATTATPTAEPSADGGITPPAPAAAEEPVAAVAAALGPAVVQLRTEGGLGSGIVYDASGLILTNAHVLGDARSVAVNFADGTTVEGTVVGTDPSVDIGVVRVDPPAGLAVARLATRAPRVGELAVAMGSPFGLEQTVTAGVVSAVDRPVPTGTGVTVGMIQTDAPINPGNSGGALANRAGEVIGVPTQILSQKGENNGVGFAVPIARAKAVADRIVAGQPTRTAFLGVSGITSAPDGSPGAALGAVEPGSPAAVAGLRAGDVVVAVGQQAIRQPADLPVAIADRSPGEQVEFTVVRHGTRSSVTVTLGTRPDEPRN